MTKNMHLVIVTDCGGSDEGRYGIAARRCFHPHNVGLTFFATAPLNTLHSGFTGAAQALSSIDHFGPLKEDEAYGLLVNAAPREGSSAGKKLRGAGRKSGGEEIYALKLRNGVWVVGPNAGYNLHFLACQVEESYLVVDNSKRETPFRSMQVMVPALAKLLEASPIPHLEFEPKPLVLPEVEKGTFVADCDELGNVYLVTVGERETWFPALGESCVAIINGKRERLRHVDDIFGGEDGEATLTTGSLTLNGEPVHYIVSLGNRASALFGNPSPKTKVEFKPV